MATRNKILLLYNKINLSYYKSDLQIVNPTVPLLRKRFPGDYIILGNNKINVRIKITSVFAFLVVYVLL